jgi:hypothetical protein
MKFPYLDNGFQQIVKNIEGLLIFCILFSNL